MKKSDSITEDDIDAYLEAKKTFHSIEKKIHDRIDKVFEVICQAFDKKKTGYWYFHGAEEGEVGDMRLSGDLDDSLYFVNGNFPRLNGYEGEFPVRFLLMSDDDIIKFLKEEQEDLRKKEEKKKEKQKADEKAKNELKKRAASKLSAQERKALGLNL